MKISICYEYNVLHHPIFRKVYRNARYGFERNFPWLVRKSKRKIAEKKREKMWEDR